MSLFSLFRRRKKKVIYTVPTNETYEYLKGDVASIEIHTAEEFSKEELDFYLFCMDVCLKVINSADFKIQLISAHNMIMTNGPTGKNLSPLEVYELFMSGKTVLDPTADNDIDITVCLYYQNNGVIGYTYPSSLKTWLNRKFFGIDKTSAYSVGTLVGNCLHEYAHKCGWTHSFRNPERNSIPYIIGDIGDRIARSYINGKQLTKIRKAS